MADTVGFIGPLVLQGATNVSSQWKTRHEMPSKTVHYKAIKRIEDCLGYLVVHLETEGRIDNDPVKITDHQIQDHPRLRPSIQVIAQIDFFTLHPQLNLGPSTGAGR